MVQSTPLLPIASQDPARESRFSDSQPSQWELNKEPWKYLGYKAFCEWAASDNDFFVIRRFGSLNTRVILKLQDEISKLEEELGVLEAENSRVDALAVNNGSFRDDMVTRRPKILEEVYAKLKEYSELSKSYHIFSLLIPNLPLFGTATNPAGYENLDSFVLSYSALRSRPSANAHEIQNVENWLLWRYEGAILDAETEYIRRTDDLISVVPKVKTPLRQFLEKFRRFRLSHLFRVKPAKLPLVYDPETTHYHSDERMEKFATLVVTIIGFAMMIVPLWWLLFVKSHIYRLAIITGFITLFLCLISTVTVARPFESLAATAAYSAVLMVFMQFGR